MLAYITRRLLIMPVLLVGVSMLIFLMMSLLTPYERAALYIQDIPKRPGAMDAIIKKYGLDDPIHLQYWHWMVGRKDPDTGEVKGGVLRGDLGFSKVGKGKVATVIGRRLPATAELALWAALPMIGVGIWLGVLSAVKHNKPLDHVLRVVSILGWSIPTFVFGLLVLLVFYARLGWFPPERLSEWALRAVQASTFRQVTGMYSIDALLNLRLDIFLDALSTWSCPWRPWPISIGLTCCASHVPQCSTRCGKTTW